MTRPDEQEKVSRPGGTAGSTPEGPVERGGRFALLLGLPGLFLSVVLFPVGLVMDIAAVVLGVQALRRAGRQHGSAPGAIPGIVLGALGLLVVTFVLLVLAIFWPEVRDYQQCMAGANTIQAQEDCVTSFRNAIQERFGLTGAITSARISS